MRSNLAIHVFFGLRTQKAVQNLMSLVRRFMMCRFLVLAAILKLNSTFWKENFLRH